ncbi:MAG: MATE family efflux transporter [Proteobacteria bacterium]|nr:MATE family efflux transporter [Pseudomonadota bacterium]
MTKTAATSPLAAAPATLGGHIGRTLALALPVTCSRVGLLTLVIADIVMTGRLGADELAYYALAMAFMMPLMLVGLGVLLGTVVMTAQAIGANRPAECGGVWRVSMIHGVVFGGLAFALSFGAEWFLLATGQAPGLARGAGGVMVMFGWGMPAMFLYFATSFFLEGISRPLPGMVVMLFANLLNIGLNGLLIHGALGWFPAMGAEGAALATTIVRWAMFAALAAYCLMRLDSRLYGVRGAIADARQIGRRLRRIGYPMGLGTALESTSFSTMTLFAGLLGAAQIAGYQIAMNLLALGFMCALGFSTAASVGVGNAIGRRDQPAVRTAGWVSVGLAAPILAAVGMIYALGAEGLAGFYSSDPDVTAIAVPALLVTALILIPDGAQGVLAGALRGAADVWPATILYVIAFWGVMVPLGYYLGVVLRGGAAGLMTAVLIGTICAALMLGLRFHLVSKRVIGRI